MRPRTSILPRLRYSSTRCGATSLPHRRQPALQFIDQRRYSFTVLRELGALRLHFGFIHIQISLPTPAMAV